MDYEAAVREKYPLAELVHDKPVKEIGQSAAIDAGGWVVLTQKALGGTPIGAAAPTSRQAWINAYNAIQQMEEEDQSE